MGSKYPILVPDKVTKVLIKFGFEKTSQKGSHVKYTRLGDPTRTVIVPMHDEIAKGTLKSILMQAEISLEEFLKQL